MTRTQQQHSQQIFRLCLLCGFLPAINFHTGTGKNRAGLRRLGRASPPVPSAVSRWTKVTRVTKNQASIRLEGPPDMVRSGWIGSAEDRFLEFCSVVRRERCCSVLLGSPKKITEEKKKQPAPVTFETNHDCADWIIGTGSGLGQLASAPHT